MLFKEIPLCPAQLCAFPITVHLRDLWKSLWERRQPPEAPEHLPLAAMPCSPAQCHHCRRNFTRNSSLPKHMLVVHGAGRPSKILQNRYLAKLMACRRMSFAICYITFKTRISFKEHMKSGTHLLAPGPAGVEGRFMGEFMLLLDGISMGDEDTFPASAVT